MAYLLLALSLFLGQANAAQDLKLNSTQDQAFRGWFTRIVWEQLRFRPNARWFHRDCAGLVKFALKESFADHSFEWKKQNSVSSSLVPPEIELNDIQKSAMPTWSYDRAIQLVQKHASFVSKNINQAKPGDLLFYDFGEAQHLMIWMGTYVAYHNGSPATKNDNGLRKQTLSHLMKWKDTRWRPEDYNPNFIGVYRFSFLQ